MNRNHFYWLLALFIGSAALALHAQGTSFLYQGRLNDGGSPASGNYDFVFSLYDAPTNGDAISLPQTNLDVAVAGGLFAANIDFGTVFTGTNYWLAIGVRPDGTTNVFTLLWPRQPLLPTPYAIFANSASNLVGVLPAAQLSGTLSSAQLSGTYSGAVSFTNNGNIFTGGFAGDGSGLANLDGSQITTGTVADARLSGNVALLNGNQIFTGTNFFTNANAFTNRGNSFVGSFFGNGLVGWIPVTGVATQAMPDAGYLLLNSNLTTVTLPPTNSLLIGDIVRISGAGAGGWLVAQNTNEFIQGIFLTASNANWLPANAADLGWQTIASSANGSRMVAAAAASGGIYTSSDSGQTWNSSSSIYSPLSVASSADGTKFFGVNNPGGIIYSTNSGSTWNLSSAPGSTAWSCLAASANGVNLAATIENGRIYTSANSGVSWTIQNGAPSADWDSIASSADGTKLAAVVYGGRIYTSGNSGVTWIQTSAPSAGWISIASSADGTKLVAVVYGGGIYTSADSGVTWIQTSVPSASWYNVAGSSDGGRIIAAASSGVVYISANSGVTWTQQPVPNQGWRGVACSADGTKLAAVYATTGTSGEIYYWSATAQTTTTTTGASGSIAGSQGAAVELQYLGGGAFMPVSGIGNFWGN